MPLPAKNRVVLYSWIGVRFTARSSVYIGENVDIDVVFPENVTIGKNVMITYGVKILSHYYDPSFVSHAFRVGHVVIEDNVFIGAGAIIVSDIVIGQGAVIAAGAVVPKDVANNTIVGGIPAKVIGERGCLPVEELCGLLSVLDRTR